MTLGQNRHRSNDPLACNTLDAALCLAALAISMQYMLALATMGQEAMWGAIPATTFWIGMLGAPLAAMAPAWLLGRFTRINPVWPAIGLATPPTIWAVGLLTEPIALLLVGGAAVVSACSTILPARHGRRRRAHSILRRRLCPECGYDLQGLTVSVCPECGE